jgi:hypothetical protein
MSDSELQRRLDAFQTTRYINEELPPDFHAQARHGIPQDIDIADAGSAGD